jgi:hypothetical protein
MQGDACCVLFELFSFNGGFFGMRRSFTICLIRWRASRSKPEPSTHALRSSGQGGFGAPYRSRKLRTEPVVWNYSPCCQVNQKRNRE